MGRAGVDEFQGKCPWEVFGRRAEWFSPGIRDYNYQPRGKVDN